MQSQSEDLETVYRTDTQRDCRAHALVLQAAGIDFGIYRNMDGLMIAVAPEDATRAKAEIDAYGRENQNQAPAAPTIPVRANGWAGVMGYVAVLVTVAVFRDRDFLEFDWFEVGKTHAGLIQDGQWWRAVTALTLHVDWVHLTGNLVFGGLFGLFAGQLLGSGLAWLTILMAGASGNLLNAWIQQPNHTSVGASTAVFAILGLVAAISWQRRAHWRESRLTRWAPIVGALVLLSYLGTGGVRTDVLAHVMGFLAGLAFGACYGKLGDRVRFGRWGQMLFGMLALIVLAVAWAHALNAHTGTN